MEIEINGTKHTIPDSSTHVTIDARGLIFAHNNSMVILGKEWIAGRCVECLGFQSPPADFTKCLAEVYDGAVISFEGM